MTDEIKVIEFPGPRDVSRQVPKRPAPEQVAAQNLRNRAREIDRLRRALAGNPSPMMRHDDSIAVAEALYVLLDRLERQQRIPKSKVLREAGIGSEGDSTKHLGQYAIPPGLPPGDREKRSQRLRKGAKRYVGIVEAAARLANLDEDEALLEVFGAAQFWRSGGAEEKREFSELAQRLCLIVEGIAAKHDLTTYFRDVERAGVSSAPSRECNARDAKNGPLEPGTIDVQFYRRFRGEQSLRWPIELYQPSWLSEVEENADLPAYPSLVLGSWQIGEAFPITIVAPVEDTVTGWPSVELRLCIAPVGQERKATPVLRIELATSFRLPVPSGQDRRPEGILTFTFPSPHRIPFTSGRFEIDGKWKISVGEIPKLPNPFRNDLRGLVESSSERQDEPSYIIFLPINGRVCEDWFQFRLSDNQYDSWDQRLSDRALGYSLCEQSHLQVEFSEYGGDTVAGLIDDWLCRDTDGLDRLLEQQVERLKQAFIGARDATRDLKDSAWQSVESRWIAFLSESES
jgi:hypothetical protein